jgi:hypothetical protein
MKARDGQRSGKNGELVERRAILEKQTLPMR